MARTNKLLAEDNKLPKSRTYITVDWSMDDLGPDGRTVACGMKITISNWQYERTLSPRQFETIIKQLGMTLVGAGRYIGVSPVASTPLIARLTSVLRNLDSPRVRRRFGFLRIKKLPPVRGGSYK